MMARGAHRSEGMRAPPGGVVHRSQHGTGSPKDGIPAVAVEDGVEKERSPAPGAHGFQSGQIRRGMDRQQLVSICGRCLSQLDTGFRTKPGDNRTKPRRCFRVIGPWIVLKAAGMGEDRDRHCSLLTQYPLHLPRFLAER